VTKVGHAVDRVVDGTGLIQVPPGAVFLQQFHFRFGMQLNFWGRYSPAGEGGALVRTALALYAYH
jgi:hypothetical protein